MASPASAPPRRLSKARRRRRRGRIVWRSVLAFLLALLTALGSFIAGLLGAPADFDLPPAPRPALLYAADGTTQIATIRPPTRREPVAADKIPAVMREAIISAEDERFLEHSGVDVLATIRAVANDLRGGPQQGGSTLTQQYVKNVYVNDDLTLRRKVQEAGLAVRLEQRISKQQIITDYLNVLYLGNGTYGVQAASKYYFGVGIEDLALSRATGQRSRTLQIARASMLAGIAPAPSAYNPVRSFELARIRQQYTLNRMVVGGFISSEEASEAFGRGVTPVQFREPETPSAAPEFTDELATQLRATYGAEDGATADDPNAERKFYGSGLRVTSTLDMQLQTALAQALREVLPDADDPQAAAVAVQISTGDVKAMSTLRRIPARDATATLPARAAEQGYDQFNLATRSYRSTGSTLKPFTLAAALENGRTLEDRVSYTGCVTVPRPEETPDYRYCNAAGEGGGGGRVSLKQALARSINTVFVPLADEVGRDKVRSVALKAGFQTAPGIEDPFSIRPPSFGLGPTAEVSTLSLATSFATLMNGGVKREPRYFTEVREGGGGTDRGVVQPGAGAAQPGVRAMPQATADQVADAMSLVATSSGSAPAAAQPFTVYGKTGTTNDSTDARFVGCAKAPEDLCLSIWMGYEDINNCELVQGPCGGMLDVNGVEQVYGGTLPAQVFARTFDNLRAARAARAEAAPAADPSAPRVPAVPGAPAGPAGDSVTTDRDRTPRSAIGDPTDPTAPAPASEPPPPEPEPSQGDPGGALGAPDP